MTISSNKMLYIFKNTKLMGPVFDRQEKDLLDVKVHHTSDYC